MLGVGVIVHCTLITVQRGIRYYITLFKSCMNSFSVTVSVLVTVSNQEKEWSQIQETITLQKFCHEGTILSQLQ